MSPHNDLIRLRHMLDHAREAAKLLEGKTRDELEGERVLQLALVRLVEIIGEAAARVSKDSQARYQRVPWADVIGMRNKLIHGYDTVDLAILWDTVINELPPLVKTLEQVLQDEAGA